MSGTLQPMQQIDAIIVNDSEATWHVSATSHRCTQLGLEACWICSKSIYCSYCDQISNDQIASDQKLNTESAQLLSN